MGLVNYIAGFKKYLPFNRGDDSSARDVDKNGLEEDVSREMFDKRMKEFRMCLSSANRMRIHLLSRSYFPRP